MEDPIEEVEGSLVFCAELTAVQKLETDSNRNVQRIVFMMQMIVNVFARILKSARERLALEDKRLAK